MFNSFLNWIYEKLLGVIEGGFEGLLSAVSIDLTKFVDRFPVAASAYGIFQAIGVGFVFAFAAWALIKFLMGNLAQVNESPVQVLVFTVISVVLIFFGNYLLQIIINIFSYPYADLMNLSSSYDKSLWSALADGITSTASGDNQKSHMILAIICLIVVAWYSLKLIIEMLQRYIMICIMFFTSPLAFSTLASASTRQIFSKWVTMFISELVIWLLNIWCVKMMFSLLQSLGTGTGATLGEAWGAVVFSIAFGKAALSVDSYLKQVGLNPTSVGRSILDDVAHQAQRMLMRHSHSGSSSSGSSGNAVLGDRSSVSAASSAAENLRSTMNGDRTYYGVSGVKQAAGDTHSVVSASRRGNLVYQQGTDEFGNPTMEPVTGVRGIVAGARYAVTGSAGKDKVVAGQDEFGHIAGTQRDINRANEAMRQNNIGFDGKNVTGNEQDIAKWAGQYGKELSSNSKMENAVTDMMKDPNVFSSEAMETFMNNADKVGGATGNAAAQRLMNDTKLENQLANQNVADVRAAASSMDNNHQKEQTARNQFGLNDPNASMKDIEDQTAHLNEKFGTDTNGQNYALMKDQKYDAKVGDLDDQGKNQVLNDAKSQYNQHMAESNRYTNLANGEADPNKKAEYQAIAGQEKKAANDIKEQYFNDNIDPSKAGVNDLKENANASVAQYNNGLKGNELDKRNGHINTANAAYKQADTLNKQANSLQAQNRPEEAAKVRAEANQQLQTAQREANAAKAMDLQYSNGAPQKVNNLSDYNSIASNHDQYQSLAAENYKQADSLKKAADRSEANGNQVEASTYRAEAAKFEQEANTQRAAAEEIEQNYAGGNWEAYSETMNRASMSEDPVEQAALQDEAYIIAAESAGVSTEGVSWNDLSNNRQDTEVGNVRTAVDTMYASGDNQGAADLAMSKTGQLDMTGYSRTNVEESSVETGYRNLENMAVSKQNTAYDVTGGTVEHGKTSATVHRNKYNSNTGRYEHSADKVNVYTNVGNAVTQKYGKADSKVQINVGKQKYYVDSRNISFAQEPTTRSTKKTSSSANSSQNSKNRTKL